MSHLPALPSSFLVLFLTACATTIPVVEIPSPICESTRESPTPAARQIAVAHEAACAIVCGSILCWGAGLEPARLDDPRTFVAIDGSDGGFCALTDASSAVCFRLEDGQIAMMDAVAERRIVDILDACMVDENATATCFSGSSSFAGSPFLEPGLVDRYVTARDAFTWYHSFDGFVHLRDGVVVGHDNQWYEEPAQVRLDGAAPVGFVVGEIRVPPPPPTPTNDVPRPPWLPAACAWSRTPDEPVRCLVGRTSELDFVDAATPPRDVTDVEIGHAGICVLYADGELHCRQPWPDLATSDGDQTLRVELDTPMMTGIVDVDVDAKLACALFRDDRVFCWGNNEGLAVTGAQLSITDPANRVEDDFVDLSLGGDHACGLTARGTVRCWGAVGGLANLRVRDAIELPIAEVTSMAALSRGTTRLVDAQGRHWLGSLDWPDPYRDYDPPPFPPEREPQSGVAAILGGVVFEQGTPLPLDAIDVPRRTLLSAEGELLEWTGGDTWQPVALPSWFWPPAIALGGGKRRCAIDAEQRGWCEMRHEAWEIVLPDQHLADIAWPCAVTTDQRVVCWDDPDSPLTPGVVEGLAPVRRIESDGQRACVLEADGGAIVCWGEWFAQRSGGGVYGDWIDVPVEVPLSP